LDWRALFDGIAGTVREGRADARALAILDSRSLVRNMFLASAARSGMLAHLGPGRTLEEVAELAGVTRTDRLRSWLGVGVDLKELVRRDGSYRVKGRRARALAAGDAFLIAHYRSMLEYQVGPYSELDELLRDEAGGGRGDLDRYAEDIAEVSRAATPFVSSLVQRAVSESAPARVLDVGCGTGIYTKIVLDSSQTAHVDGVDLAENVIAAAKVELAPYGGRVALHADDIVAWLARTPGRFDLIMLANNIYYFDPGSREALLRDLGATLNADGELLVITMTAPGSVAASHLDFMLRCQSGSASLPELDDLRADLALAGYSVLEEVRLVPTEPFVAIRARRSVL